MPDSVLFDGVNDFIEFALNEGGAASPAATAFIWKRNTTGAVWTQAGYVAESSVGAKQGMGIDGSGTGSLVHDVSSGQALWNNAADPALGDNTGWVLVVINNPGGAGSLTANVYDYDTATWLITDDVPNSGTSNPLELDWNIGDSVFIGAWPDSSLTLNDYFSGNILIGAWWRGTELGSVERDALRFSLQEWINLEPSIGWRLDQTTGTYIGVDDTPGLQTSGGTLDTGDAPAGWTDTGVADAIRGDYSRFPKYKLRR